jgi:ankyrin repeat protein
MNLIKRLPLWAAASHGYGLVVELLLATDGVDTNHKDSSGRTPLYLAAGNGHEAVVKHLLQRQS